MSPNPLPSLTDSASNPSFYATSGLSAQSTRYSRPGSEEYHSRPSQAPQIPDEELHLFASHCKRFYFSIDRSAESSNFISSTLAKLPPDHRQAYARLQSFLRAQAHLHHLRSRVSAFHTLMSSLTVSGLLAPNSRHDLASAAAKAERHRRYEEFAKKWCSAGTEPFFRCLWGVWRLQSRGRGGGRGRRVVWEVDDAVFQESGGPEFMHEAVTILKGVLGFDEQALTAQYRRVEHSNCTASSCPLEDVERPLLDREDSIETRVSECEDSEEVELNRPRLRLWICPAHLDDGEAEKLMRVSPVRAKDVRFPLVQPGRGLIEGTWQEVRPGVLIPPLDQEDQEGVVRVGTGRMWVGLEYRNSGWEGSRWFRFFRWWRKCD